MALDLLTLLRDLEADSDGFTRISRNPLAQFGRPSRQYLGATLLPEREVEANLFTEDKITYRTIVANSGTRYSPTQKKAGDLLGSFLVELGYSDIAAEFTSREYDALLRMLANNASMDAMVTITNWLDTKINLAMVEHVEKERWLAIVDASVTRTGDNEYSETITYSNPSGHRVAPGAVWSTDTTDIFAEIQAGADLLATKGYTVSRMIAPRPIVAIMAGNNTVKTRVGVAVVNTSGQITSAAGRAFKSAIDGALQADGLPAIEQYDLQYRTQTGTTYFLERDVFVMVGTTGRDEEIDLGDTVQIVTDTLGYSALGIPAGKSESGRVIRAVAKEDKPPRIEAEGWQASLPVITEPEAIFVIDGIT